MPLGAAPCRAVPTSPAHLQPRAGPQPKQPPQTKPAASAARDSSARRACVRKALPPRSLRLRPHDDLIAVSQWGGASVGCRSAESRGRRQDPEWRRHLVRGAVAPGPGGMGCLWGLLVRVLEALSPPRPSEFFLPNT